MKSKLVKTLLIFLGLFFCLAWCGMLAYLSGVMYKAITPDSWLFPIGAVLLMMLVLAIFLSNNE